MLDQSLNRSQRDIQVAFLALLDSHDFDALTVAAIAKAAKVSRQTFYNYYASPFDLATTMITAYLAPIQAVIRARAKALKQPGSFAAIAATGAPAQAKLLVENRRDYQRLRQLELGAESFARRLTALLSAELAPLFGPAEVLTTRYLTHLLIAELDYILATGKVPTPAMITKSIGQINQLFS